MTIDNITLDEILVDHAGCFVESFDAGLVGDGYEPDVRCSDVIVWPDEESSINDDGSNAIAIKSQWSVNRVSNNSDARGHKGRVCFVC